MTERILLALRRVIARGMWSIILSDNGKTIKAANKEPQRCWRVLESDQTQNVLSEKKIQGKFIVCGESPMVGWVLWTAFTECQDATEETIC